MCHSLKFKLRNQQGKHINVTGPRLPIRVKSVHRQSLAQCRLNPQLQTNGQKTKSGALGHKEATDIDHLQLRLTRHSSAG